MHKQTLICSILGAEQCIFGLLIEGGAVRGGQIIVPMYKRARRTRQIGQAHQPQTYT